MCIIDPAWEDANTPDYPAFRRIDNVHGVGCVTRIGGRRRYFQKAWCDEAFILRHVNGPLCLEEVMEMARPMKEEAMDRALAAMHAFAKENE